MKIVNFISLWIQWLGSESAADFRENKKMIYESIVRTNTSINQIILTFSLAALAAIATLNKPLFKDFSILSFIVLAIFIIVILLSVVNLFLSSVAMRAIQKTLIENWKSLKRPNSGMEKVPFARIQSILNYCVLLGFCAGVILLLALLGLHIFGAEA